MFFKKLTCDLRKFLKIGKYFRIDITMLPLTKRREISVLLEYFHLLSLLFVSADIILQVLEPFLIFIS